MNKFDHIQRLLGLTDKERGQILSINRANHPGRFYREVWIGLGGTHSAVYATEVSDEEYAVYTTEESEKFGIAEVGQGTGRKSGTGRETHCGNEKGKENVKR